MFPFPPSRAVGLCPLLCFPYYTSPDAPLNFPFCPSCSSYVLCVDERSAGQQSCFLLKGSCRPRKKEVSRHQSGTASLVREEPCSSWARDCRLIGQIRFGHRTCPYLGQIPPRPIEGPAWASATLNCFQEMGKGSIMGHTGALGSSLAPAGCSLSDGQPLPKGPPILSS